jgi:hypothetical protein
MGPTTKNESPRETVYNLMLKKFIEGASTIREEKRALNEKHEIEFDELKKMLQWAREKMEERYDYEPMNMEYKPVWDYDMTQKEREYIRWPDIKIPSNWNKPEKREPAKRDLLPDELFEV